VFTLRRLQRHLEWLEGERERLEKRMRTLLLDDGEATKWQCAAAVFDVGLVLPYDVPDDQVLDRADAIAYLTAHPQHDVVWPRHQPAWTGRPCEPARPRSRCGPGRGQRGSVCFCDACGTVANCDTSYRIDAAREDAITRSFGLRPS